MRWLAILMSCLPCAGAAPLQAEKPLTFDAASVKPRSQTQGAAGGLVIRKQPGGGRGAIDPPSGGPGTAHPGRIHYPGVTLEFVLLKAYAISNYQLDGPDWLRSDRFDIDATMPAGTTVPQFRMMLQNLLAGRFKLAVHRETRDLAGYSLAVGKNGTKIKPSGASTASPDDGSPDPPLKLGADGYFIPPPRAGVFLQMTRPPGARATFRQVTLQTLADTLQNYLKRPVSDATGLTSPYDFVLDFSMEGLDLGGGRIPVSPGAGDPPMDIFSALQAQLGLKLEPKKSSVEVIVVDHAERIPTEN